MVDTCALAPATPFIGQILARSVFTFKASKGMSTMYLDLSRFLRPES